MLSALVHLPTDNENIAYAYFPHMNILSVNS